MQTSKGGSVFSVLLPTLDDTRLPGPRAPPPPPSRPLPLSPPRPVRVCGATTASAASIRCVLFIRLADRPARWREAPVCTSFSSVRRASEPTRPCASRPPSPTPFSHNSKCSWYCGKRCLAVSIILMFEPPSAFVDHVPPSSERRAHHNRSLHSRFENNTMAPACRGGLHFLPLIRAGAIARGVATIIMYPFLRAKTMMQVRVCEGSTDAVSFTWHTPRSHHLCLCCACCELVTGCEQGRV